MNYEQLMNNCLILLLKHQIELLEKYLEILSSMPKKDHSSKEDCSFKESKMSNRSVTLLDR